MASSASSPGLGIPGKIRLQPRLSSVAPPFCEQRASQPAAHQSPRLVSGRSTIRAAGHVDVGTGLQGITPHGRATKRAEVDLGLRPRRSSGRVVDGQSTPRSEYRNRAVVPQSVSLRTWPTPTRGNGAGQSGLAHREAAQVAETHNTAALAAVSPELNPAERLWLWFREHHWSNRVYPDEASLIHAAKRSHRQLRRAQVRSICATRWVTRKAHV